MVSPGFRQLTIACPQPRPLVSLVPTQVEVVGQLIELLRGKIKPDEWLLLKSTLVRCVVPALGGPKPRGRRASFIEIEAALAFLHQQPIKRLEKAGSVLELFLERAEPEKEKRHKPRFYLKKLVDFASGLGLIHLEESQIYYQFKELKKSRVYPEDIPLVQGRRHGVKGGFSLELSESHYVTGERKADQPLAVPAWQSWLRYLTLFPKAFFMLYWVYDFESRPPCFLANKHFDEDIMNLISFMETRQHHREPSINKDIGTILRIAGFYVGGQKKRLDKLRLTTIIPLVNVKLERSAFLDEEGKRDREAFLLAKAEAQEDLEDEAQAMIEEIDAYLISGTISPGAAVTILTGLINAAKYIYRDETRKFKLRRGFQDISLIEALRVRRAEFDQQLRDGRKTVIPREKRMVPWPRLLEAVEKLRTEAEMVYRYHVRHTRKLKSGKVPIEKIRRTPRARAGDMQQFLMTAIMTATPPNRPGVYINLELGRTFVQGVRCDGIFTPIARMSDPSQAAWWFHLMPEDYKTGKTYGEWWAELPNTKFGDGKTLYTYINEWLTEWRPVFCPEHNYLFTEQIGGQLDGSNFAAIIERAICRFTDVRVNPHSFRHIYVTYLRSIGATEEQLESAATAMLHSRHAQCTIYDLLDQEAKMGPSLALTQEIAESFYTGFKAASVEH